MALTAQRAGWAIAARWTMRMLIRAGLRSLRGEDVGERLVSTPNLPFGVA